jgi:hypothetical protein
MAISDAERTGTTLLEVASHDPSVEKGKQEFLALWEWLGAQFKAGRDGKKSKKQAP